MINQIGEVKSVKEVPYPESDKVVNIAWIKYKKHYRVIARNKTTTANYRGNNGVSLEKVLIYVISCNKGSKEE